VSVGLPLDTETLEHYVVEVQVVQVEATVQVVTTPTMATAVEQRWKNLAAAWRTVTATLEAAMDSKVK
jgi:hypothetical protein